MRRVLAFVALLSFIGFAVGTSEIDRPWFTTKTILFTEDKGDWTKREIKVEDKSDLKPLMCIRVNDRRMITCFYANPDPNSDEATVFDTIPFNEETV